MKITLINKPLLFALVVLTTLPSLCIAVEENVESPNPVQHLADNSLSEQQKTVKKSLAPPKKTISITIDDLPFVGEYRNFHLNMMIETMTKENIPATGFIIASEVRQNNWEILRKFRDAGFGLGNHTLNHANLNRMDTKEYIREIQKADNILLPVLTKPKFFRYPYLAMSSGKKREDILCYLAQKEYQVAPITIDSKDFVFTQRLLSVEEKNRRAYFEELKPFYLDFIWQQTLRAEEHSKLNRNNEQAQILLIHANLLNAYVLPDIIHMYQQKGYAFVSLEQALSTFKHPIQCARPPAKKLAKTQTKPQTVGNKDHDNFVQWD